MSFLPTLALEKGRTQFYKSDLTKDDTSITSTVNVFRFGSDWFKMSAASSNEQSVFWNKKLVEYNAEYEAATILLDYISQGLSLNALKEYWFGVRGAYGKYHPPGSKVQTVYAAVAAAWLIPRSVWDELGGLNDKFFLYFDNFF